MWPHSLAVGSFVGSIPSYAQRGHSFFLNKFDRFLYVYAIFFLNVESLQLKEVLDDCINK